ncbi:MAG: patatin-like phospholipase family protein [Steroidobacteraceae bacterium]
MSLARTALTIALALAAGACATSPVIENKPLAQAGSAPGYTLGEFARNLNRRSDELMLGVAFSGGGTRAAALAYGVMLELRDTRVVMNGKEQRLLDAVSAISSVSGGSFTSAYYGLYGDRLFVDFEQRFLRQDVEGALLRGVFNPLRWVEGRSRTEMAVDYYQETLFGNATFADLMKKDSPLILINASDLGSGARFSFVQEYFNLLCSDLSSFPLARAVAASSAVPVVFDPVVVENYAGCKEHLPSWLVAAKQREGDDPDLRMIVQGDVAYQDKVAHKFAQFVDGGITDNLGLRAMLDTLELVGGAQEYLKSEGIPTPRRIAIISVNASTDKPMGIGTTSAAPGIGTTMSAVTSIQLHRYNVGTLLQTQQSLGRWAGNLSTPERPVTPYFIDLSFEEVQDEPLQEFLNEIPTSFKLNGDQVDQLIATGRSLLRNDVEFQRLLSSLREQGDAAGAGPSPR